MKECEVEHHNIGCNYAVDSKKHATHLYLTLDSRFSSFICATIASFCRPNPTVVPAQNICTSSSTKNIFTTWCGLTKPENSKSVYCRHRPDIKKIAHTKGTTRLSSVWGARLNIEFCTPRRLSLSVCVLSSHLFGCRGHTRRKSTLEFYFYPLPPVVLALILIARKGPAIPFLRRLDYKLQSIFVYKRNNRFPPLRIVQKEITDYCCVTAPRLNSSVSVRRFRSFIYRTTRGERL